MQRWLLIAQALHNFVVQSYNELLILDCASTAQLRCAEPHTSYAETALDCASNQVRQQSSAQAIKCASNQVRQQSSAEMTLDCKAIEKGKDEQNSSRHRYR
ncbi:hypothetical protein DRN76_03400 [Methanosarcinales archaeon]|nr:MAG: hypothetical protein DRN76_03400 [Methanosarcinales archaeon]